MSRMLRERLADGGLLLVVVCVVILTVNAVRGGVTSDSGLVERGSAKERTLTEEEWRAVTMSGHSDGEERAPVVLVVFSDYECPACRALERGILPRLDSTYPGAIRVVRRHWPLSSHEFAFNAALAAECAAAQGKFLAMHTTLFEHQRAIGFLPFRDLALRAGVPRIGEFERCATDAVEGNPAVNAVERDIALVTSLGAKGTPAVAINGRFFPAGVNRDVLDSLVSGLR